MSDDTAINAVELAADLTIAWLGNTNNRVSADDVPAFLRAMHDTVTALAAEPANPSDDADGTSATETFIPATTVRKSLASKDHIISMIDGKPYRTLRRHLKTNGLTPEEYRKRYNLKPDYPMVAETYSEQRRAMAHKIGLSRKSPVASAAAAVEAPAEKPKRKPKSA